MKKLATKAEIRSELERQVEEYLNDGGKVAEVGQGISGKDPLKSPLYLSGRLFSEPRSSRTFVPDVVAAIERRRQAQIQRAPAKKRSRLNKTRRKTIYDDFGEPLRRVWVDD